MILVYLGVIVVGFCVLVSVLEIAHGGRGRERELRTQMIIEKWTREHPQSDSGGSNPT